MATNSPGDTWLDEHALNDRLNDESQELDPEAGRLGRIEDYRQQALQREDPLAACVGLQNAAMMEFSCRFENVLRRNMEQAGNETNQALDLRAMTMYLAINRQIDRNTNLALRMDESKGSGGTRQRRAGFVAINEPLRPAARPR